MRTVRSLHALFFLALLGVFLFSPQQIHAVTLTPLLSHEGLTIEQPLTLSSADPAKDITRSLSFGEQKEVIVTAPKEGEILAEAIVVPTVSIETTEIEESVIEQPKSPPAKTQKSPATPIPTAYTQTSATTPTPIPPTTTPQQPMTTLQLSNGGLNADKLFSMTNAYRQSKGLPPVQKDDRACQVAVSRAPEIASEIAEGRMHSGIRARNLPYWNSEIIITMRTEEEAFNWWINDTIHREAIEGNYAYSCTACHGNACVQEFTNFQPK